MQQYFIECSNIFFSKLIIYILIKRNEWFLCVCTVLSNRQDFFVCYLVCNKGLIHKLTDHWELLRPGMEGGRHRVNGGWLGPVVRGAGAVHGVLGLTPVSLEPLCTKTQQQKHVTCSGFNWYYMLYRYNWNMIKPWQYLLK